MSSVSEVHDALARLLTYPEAPNGREGYRTAVAVVAGAFPATSGSLQRFADGLAEFDDGQLEELYTRTFDNVAERSLEVGWQLFGENYARGALMVRFRGLLREYRVPERAELPDHMMHVLPLLGRMPADLASAFAGNQVLQAAEKMLESLRAIESPWAGVLEATLVVLESHRVPVATSEATQ